MANEYIEMKDHTIIRVTCNKINGDILVDTKHVDRLKCRIWSIKATSTSKNHYVVAKFDGKQVGIHRFIMDVGEFIMGREENVLVDHVSRNVLDNRETNLRVTDHSTNNLNSSFSKNNTSGRTGVKYKVGQGIRSDSWVGQYDFNGKRKTKQFAIEVHGADRAYELAVEFRENGEKEHSILTGKTFND